ncbi:MAG: hypothetical protein [Microviridae sp.]|nr:MAG: hypothetical protein [Microviridae sp.]
MSDVADLRWFDVWPGERYVDGPCFICGALFDVPRTVLDEMLSRPLSEGFFVACDRHSREECVEWLRQAESAPLCEFGERVLGSDVEEDC